MKSFMIKLGILITVVIFYLCLKIYVDLTPTKNDDDLPSEFLNFAQTLANVEQAVK